MTVKYMGSKRFMLMNGFGEAIVERARSSERVVDLFAGSGAVAWFAAQATGRPVHAYDLQSYAAVLSLAVIGRTTAISAKNVEATWLAAVREALQQSPLLSREPESFTETDVLAARERCAATEVGSIWSAYGGHYFSPNQALTLDIALELLPKREPHRSFCHAAVIAAAAYCAAAPGHTAQPFQPTDTALRYITESWQRDPLQRIAVWVNDTARRHARVRGKAGVADAVEQARRLKPSDLVIVDPPYSAVQYSRFYHVLETVARAVPVDVSGVGRYPPREDRPSSRFSLRTQSEPAISELLDNLAATGCDVLLTFPAGESSNGLSGTEIVRIASRKFDVSTKTVLGRFSTMGGNNAVRASRHPSVELILSLSPR
ncbi:MAG TPA: DNA adenine methylase [Conexibacter sp.]|nr:DNA adenine methylase [Conexibacter sp.]